MTAVLPADRWCCYKARSQSVGGVQLKHCDAILSSVGSWDSRTAVSVRPSGAKICFACSWCRIYSCRRGSCLIISVGWEGVRCSSSWALDDMSCCRLLSRSQRDRNLMSQLSSGTLCVTSASASLAFFFRESLLSLQCISEVREREKNTCNRPLHVFHTHSMTFQCTKEGCLNRNATVSLLL